MKERQYLCIDLKSFYASVECVERGLNPLTTNLAVADPERSEKTICLAISPSMKALGIRNRCRVFEIPKSVPFIMAPPRMSLYMKYAADIYGIYLKYISKEDIHVYSIDEAFLDVTDYLPLYRVSAKELGIRIMEDILKSVGITATCGIGTNLYLAKIALDITAKHEDDHIGYLNEELFRETMWKHQPLTDFWRIGAGTVKRLQASGMYSMGDIAKADEDMLYRMFGIDAELLIHAWGRETTTIADIKAYKPKDNSLSSGQVLPRDYSYEECRLIVKEMTDLLCLDLVDKGLVTESVTLYLGYSNRLERTPAKGSCTMTIRTNSDRAIMPYVLQLYDRIADKKSFYRRVNLGFNHVCDEAYEQYDLFTDPVELQRDRKLQQAELSIKKKFGKNAILKGMNLEQGATTRERNEQIGGHKSGE